MNLEVTPALPEPKILTERGTIYFSSEDLQSVGIDYRIMEGCSDLFPDPQSFINELNEKGFFGSYVQAYTQKPNGSKPYWLYDGTYLLKGVLVDVPNEEVLAGNLFGNLEDIKGSVAGGYLKLPEGKSPEEYRSDCVASLKNLYGHMYFLLSPRGEITGSKGQIIRKSVLLSSDSAPIGKINGSSFGCLYNFCISQRDPQSGEIGCLRIPHAFIMSKV